MMSDVCKHCSPAPCLEACPTGALFRTEFDTVVVQQDICNGCGYCVPACPFGVVELNVPDGKAHKCTLCYDRLKGGLEPACAKACPTDSIQFGELSELQDRARKRVESLQDQGREDAYLYGAPESPGATGGIEHLNAFFLLTDRPEVYNLPPAPSLPSKRLVPSLLTGLATMAGLALAAVIAFTAVKIERECVAMRTKPTGGRIRPRKRVRRSPVLRIGAKPIMASRCSSRAITVSSSRVTVPRRNRWREPDDRDHRRSVRPRKKQLHRPRRTLFVPRGRPHRTRVSHRRSPYPERWYNMLRILRRTSPMSIGSWTLAAFGTQRDYCGLQFLADHPGGLVIGRGARGSAAATAAGMV